MNLIFRLVFRNIIQEEMFFFRFLIVNNGMTLGKSAAPDILPRQPDAVSVFK